MCFMVELFKTNWLLSAGTNDSLIVGSWDWASRPDGFLQTTLFFEILPGGSLWPSFSTLGHSNDGFILRQTALTGAKVLMTNCLVRSGKHFFLTSYFLCDEQAECHTGFGNCKEPKKLGKWLGDLSVKNGSTKEGKHICIDRSKIAKDYRLGKKIKKKSGCYLAIDNEDEITQAASVCRIDKDQVEVRLFSYGSSIEATIVLKHPTSET